MSTVVSLLILIDYAIAETMVTVKLESNEKLVTSNSL